MLHPRYVQAKHGETNVNLQILSSIESSVLKKISCLRYYGFTCIWPKKINRQHRGKSLLQEAYLHYVRIIPRTFIRSEAPSFNGTCTYTTQEIWQLTERKRV